MLAILDYDAGNIESVRLALRHVGGEPVFVRDADAARNASRIVFPGVGSAKHCMANLIARGFDHTLRRALEAGTPVLAICIGMQLLFDSSEEDGGVTALGLLPGRNTLFRPANPVAEKVPHMGWNSARTPRPHPLLPPDLPGGDFYFVHSYHAVTAWPDTAVSHDSLPAGREQGIVYGVTDYAGVAFASMVGRGSLFAAQFHPEKSAAAGLDILRRFVHWDGKPCS